MACSTSSNSLVCLSTLSSKPRMTRARARASLNCISDVERVVALFSFTLISFQDGHRQAVIHACDHRCLSALTWHSLRLLRAEMPLPMLMGVLRRVQKSEQWYEELRRFIEPTGSDVCLAQLYLFYNVLHFLDLGGAPIRLLKPGQLPNQSRLFLLAGQSVIILFKHIESHM